MSLVPLNALPDDARVWCFGATDGLTPASVERLRSATADFLREWTAHRADLRAGFGWVDDRFLVVAVDESHVGASGCSIDALTAHVRSLEEATGVTLLDSAPVWFRDAAGMIRCAGRDEFRRLADAGAVDGGTPVFDLTVDRLGDVRARDWEVEAGRSWHARLL